MINGHPPAEPKEVGDTIIVDDIHTFVGFLGAWHHQRIATLQHMLTMPEGTEVEVEGNTFILKGDALIAYKAGITVALAELGTLPFGAELSGEIEH